MTGHGDFVTPPPLPEAQPSRLAVVWAGNPQWTDKNLSLADTKPGDSSINIGISDARTAARIPLTPWQAWELVTELVVRLDILGVPGGPR